METAGESPPGKELVMRILPRAAVLMVLLGLSLGTPGVFAKSRSQAPRPARTAVWSALQFVDALWSRVAEGWIKEGPRIDPLGSPGSSNGTQPQNIDAGPGIDPLGSPSSTNRTQPQNIDEGPGINPWG
jgi:hypothetical protein